MNIIINNKVRFNSPKDSYVVSVFTMGKFGDHEIKLTFNNNVDGIENLRKLIICLEICSKQFPDGKPVSSTYDDIPYFNYYLSDNWFSVEVDNVYYFDYLKDYKVRYYDDKSVSYKVSITNDEKMVEMITDFEIRSE